MDTGYAWDGRILHLLFTINPTALGCYSVRIKAPELASWTSYLGKKLQLLVTPIFYDTAI